MKETILHYIPAGALEAMTAIWSCTSYAILGASYAILGASLTILVLVTFGAVLHTVWTFRREMTAFAVTVVYVQRSVSNATPDGFEESLFLFLCSMLCGAVVLAVAYLMDEAKQERINQRIARERHRAIQQRMDAAAHAQAIFR